ncbi:MAG: hypothetical protein GX049_02715 [Alcaligenaceae bacterium]|nr:hypothetical protein [Alcaligenaceae bacterium]
MRAKRISSADEPINAKVFKDALKTYVDGLANREAAYKDTDGKPRLYIKFLNGRTACLVAREDVDEEQHLENALFEHECDSVGEIRRFWSTVGAAISFNISFSFTCTNRSGKEVELVLLRYWDDEHAADEFAESVIATVGMALEDVSKKDGQLNKNHQKDFDARLRTVEKNIRLIRKLLEKGESGD